ncbi:MAG: helix-turn-helix transcriptional regulator [Desulfobacterales bacterium]|nr:helix-turn-helix transcriptional regulator [Desulfobacterales bacterium]
MKQKTEMQKRTSALLIDLINRNGLSNRKLGRIMNLGRNTINNYRRLKATPSSTFFHELAELFDVNLTWVYTGKGEMYHGDGLWRGKRHYITMGYDPDTGPESLEKEIPFGEDQDVSKDGRVSETLKKALVILKSGTTYANDLFMDIEHMDRAMKATMEYDKMADDMMALQNEATTLRKRLMEFSRASKKPRARKKKKNP